MLFPKPVDNSYSCTTKGAIRYFWWRLMIFTLHWTAPHFIFCSISILLLFTEMTFWTNHLLSVPLCPLSFVLCHWFPFPNVYSFIKWSLMTCVWLLPANGLCSLWTVPPYIRFHVQGFLVTLRDGCLFFVVLNITRILHYVNLFFYFFLFFLYVSHNCLFYYVFSDNLFF